MVMNLIFCYYTSLAYPMPGEQREMTSYMTCLILGVIDIPFWFWQFKQEFAELASSGAMEIVRHFRDWANWLDAIHLLITPLLIVNNSLRSPFIKSETNDQLAALISFCVIAKTYDWLKLFEGTAFYILLIERTVYSIKDFLTPFWIALVMFGMPMVILKPSDADNAGNTTRLDFYAPVNAMLDQY